MIGIVIVLIFVMVLALGSVAFALLLAHRNVTLRARLAEAEEMADTNLANLLDAKKDLDYAKSTLAELRAGVKAFSEKPMMISMSMEQLAGLAQMISTALPLIPVPTDKLQ